jgi:ribonuclease HII
MLFRHLPPQAKDYFERLYYSRGYQKIAGVDEVGRGCLAGPVLAAAVIPPRKGFREELFDSKFRQRNGNSFMK